MPTLRLNDARVRTRLLLTVLLSCGAASAAHASGWAVDLAPDIRALTQAGGQLFAFSYTTGQKPSLIAQCIELGTGKVLWKNALTHMRTDVIHVDAVGEGESLYVTVADALDPASGYLLSLAAKPSAFELKPARPGFQPGLALIGGRLWSTTGRINEPVRWRLLDRIHNAWVRPLGRGARGDCIGRPVGVRGRLLLPEGGALVVATPTGKQLARIPISTCTWGEPVALGTIVAVMSSDTTRSMTVAGVNPATRKVAWRVKAPPNPQKIAYVPTLTGSGGRVLATYATTSLVIDAKGRVVKRLPLGGVTRTVSVVGGRVVCALKNHHLVIVNLTDGTLRELGVAEDEVGAMLLMRGHLYVAAGATLRDWGTL